MAKGHEVYRVSFYLIDKLFTLLKSSKKVVKMKVKFTTQMIREVVQLAIKRLNEEEEELEGGMTVDVDAAAEELGELLPDDEEAQEKILDRAKSNVGR